MNETILEDLFPLGIRPGMIIPYAHKGKWAVHQLLPLFFEHIGAFHLRLATFNISEDALRPIFFMKERDELLSVQFLFDRNVQRHKIDMLLFANNVAQQVRISSSHMKVMLVHNEKCSIAVVGSANMNRNLRHEAGFIVTDHHFDFFSDYFDNVYQNDSIQVYGAE